MSSLTSAHSESCVHMTLLGLSLRSIPLRGICMLTLLMILVGCGSPDSGMEEADEPDPNLPARGLWVENPWATAPAKETEADDALADRIRQLETLGYTAGTEPMPTRFGVVRYDPDRAYNGFTLVLSSHTTEARLIDMTGNVHHTWTYDPDAPWPSFEGRDNPIAGEENTFEMRRYFHRAHLYPNGDLLAMMYAFGLLKLDKDSKILWRASGPVHHDMEVQPDGTIYALYRLAGMMPDFHPSKVVLDEFIAIYTPEGEMTRKVSILSALRNSDFSPSLKTARRHGELFHSNAVKVLDGRFADRNPNFKAGNVLTSLRQTDMVCIVDMDTEKVVWSLTGMWRAQHDPRFTDAGTMTVFDNRGVAHLLPGNPGHLGSRIIEFNPLTQEIVWVFTGDNETQLWSQLAGSAVRLPNGNTFINETRRGRYIEITPDKQVVWEYINPHQTGPNLEYIADLYDVLRYPPEAVSGWLGESPAATGDGSQNRDEATAP